MIQPLELSILLLRMPILLRQTSILLLLMVILLVQIRTLSQMPIRFCGDSAVSATDSAEAK